MAFLKYGSYSGYFSLITSLKQITQAREMFYEYLKVRPDVRLELSDIRDHVCIVLIFPYPVDSRKFPIVMIPAGNRIPRIVSQIAQNHTSYGGRQDRAECHALV
mgnify:CR=1 FL=1